MRQSSGWITRPSILQTTDASTAVQPCTSQDHTHYRRVHCRPALYKSRPYTLQTRPLPSSPAQIKIIHTTDASTAVHSPAQIKIIHTTDASSAAECCTNHELIVVRVTCITVCHYMVHRFTDEGTYSRAPTNSTHTAGAHLVTDGAPRVVDGGSDLETTLPL